MSVSPRDFLREARAIAEREPGEVQRRTAIGRAYYAAFHGARRFHDELPRPGRSEPGSSEHQKLIHQLRNPDPGLAKEMRLTSFKAGDLLLRLRPLRVRADYELRVDVPPQAMTDAIETAAQILNLVDPK